MDINTYRTLIIEELEKDLTCEIKTADIYKMNDEKLHGICIKTCENAGPIYYVDQAFEDNVSIETFTNDILDTIEFYTDEYEGNISEETIINKMDPNTIRPRLVGTELNTHWLKDIAHIDLPYGLSVTADFVINEFKIPISTEITKQLDYDPIQKAIDNIKDANEGTLYRIEDTLFGDEIQNLLDTNDLLVDNMYVLSNANKTFGATQILNTMLLNDIQKRINGDFYILPSSVHEVIIVPNNMEINEKQLYNMVKTANESPHLIAKNEILTTKLYHYDNGMEEVNV